MGHSLVVKPRDRSIGLYLFDETNRVRAEIERLQKRLELLEEIKTALRICTTCTGSGTVCDGRTEETDMPIYNPCRACGGKGHNRENQ